MSKEIRPYNDIRPTNDKDQRHGYWEVYMINGNVSFKCYFVNDRLVGYDEWYNYKSNELEDKTFFII